MPLSSRSVDWRIPEALSVANWTAPRPYISAGANRQGLATATGFHSHLMGNARRAISVELHSSTQINSKTPQPVQLGGRRVNAPAGCAIGPANAILHRLARWSRGWGVEARELTVRRDVAAQKHTVSSRLEPRDDSQSSQKILEPLGRQLCVDHGVHDVFVAKIVLQGPCAAAVIGQLVTACMGVIPSSELAA
jgi:hypothetical protein